MPAPSELIRIQKYLSEKGICSRREAERLMLEGKVQVNGHTVKELGTKVDPDKDKVEVDAFEISGSPKKLYLKLHKPVGYVSSNPQDGEKEARTLINIKERLYNVGRLDKDSSGLLLFTNDGVFAYRMTHPKFEHEKEYVVVVDQKATTEQVNKMAAGLPMLGKRTQPCKIYQNAPQQLKFILKEGMNRQIRRMCQKVGLEVVHLKRTRQHLFILGELPVGKWAELARPQVEQALREFKPVEASPTLSRSPRPAQKSWAKR